MYPFALNIRAIRADSGLNQDRFAESIGVAKQTVLHWEKGRIHHPREQSVIDTIKAVYHVTEHDLFERDGYAARVANIAPAISDTFAQLCGNVAAGDPREAIETDGTHWIRPDVLDRYPGGFFLHVSGDSMDKVIPDGSWAYVAPVEVHTGGIAAVKVNGDDACIKRIRISHELNAIKLCPESTNPAHTPRLIDSDSPDAPDVRILGRVVWFDCDVN